MMDEKTQEEHHADSMHHITPVPIYVGIFLLLMVLTAITVAVAYVDLAAWSTPIAIVIAIVKATAVVLIFMHVKYSPRVIGMIVVGSVVFLVILFLITLSDYLTRDWPLT